MMDNQHYGSLEDYVRAVAVGADLASARLF
jgi:hypothetical protein